MKTPKIPGSWEECIAIARNFNDHYSLAEDEQKVVFDLAWNLPMGSRFLEIGVCHGKTHAILAYVANRIGAETYGIDYDQHEGKIVDVQKKMDELDLRANLIVADSRTYDWKLPVDLLLIDGGHDSGTVPIDARKYTPFVQPGGYVLFHDWVEGHPGNAHEWIEKSGREVTKGWIDMGTTRNLKVFQRPL